MLSWLRHELAWRRQLASRRRYLRRTFRNSAELIQGLVAKTPCAVAVCQDGVEIRHPPGRTGLALMILEVWFEQVYTGAFYTPLPGDIIIDAGANIGLFSLLVARVEPGCRVFAFEPFAENFELLQANVCSAATANVFPSQLALSGESGLREMFDGGNRSQDHRLADTPTHPSTGSVAIPTASFADVLERAAPGPIALFKCDIEGSEHDLFLNASTRDLRRVRKFAIEYHDNLRPGTLDLLQRRLGEGFDLEVKTHGSKAEGGYGMIYATAKI